MVVVARRPDIGSAIPLGQIVLLLRDHLDDSAKQAALYHLAHPSNDVPLEGDVCLVGLMRKTPSWPRSWANFSPL